MNWQGLIVALIVGLAAVSLYRHVRGLISDARPATPATQPLCRGCGDCAEPTASATRTPPTQDALNTPVTH